MVYDIIEKRELSVHECIDKLKEALDKKDKQLIDHYMKLLIEEIASIVVS